MTKERATDILDLLRWVVNILILIVGFFVVNKLKAIDAYEVRLRAVELYQAGAIERDIQQTQKLDLIIEELNKWDREVAKLKESQDNLYKLLILSTEQKKNP